MRRVSPLPLLLCSLLSLYACSDETAPSATPDQGAADMSATPDMPVIEQPDQADPADLAPDQAAPEDMALDMVSEDMAPDLAPDMEEDMAPDMEELPPDPCAFPSDDPQCPQGAWGASSVLSSFYVVPNRSCCFDFTNDGQIDNVVGAQIISLANMLGFADVNASVAAAINSGRLVYLITYANWSNAVADGSIDLAMLSGTDTDLDYQDNLQGQGSFYPDPDSLDAQGKPKWSFSSASVSAPAMPGEMSTLVASGGSLDVVFPGLVDAVELRLDRVQLEAHVVGGATLEAGGRVALVQGRLGGVLPRDRFYGSLNTVARECACLGQDIFAFDDVTNRYTCTLAASACTNDPDDGCRSVGDRTLCSSLAFLSRTVDVDLDGNMRNDGFSFGATFEAVGTQLIDP